MRGIALFTVVAWAQWVANPLESVPQGWVFLDRETIDTLSGGFHDEVTGVFVEATLSSASFIIEPSVGRNESQRSSAQSGVHNGVRYRIASRRTDRQRERESDASRIQQCERFEVTFLPDETQGASWNFAAVICDQAERARVQELVFAKADDIRSLEEGPIRRSIGQPVPRDKVEEIGEGSMWSGIRELLGPPVWSDEAADKGFLVEYELRSNELNGPTSAVLVFTQNRRLTEKRFE
jgi:hypothetical protein